MREKKERNLELDKIRNICILKKKKSICIRLMVKSEEKIKKIVKGETKYLWIIVGHVWMILLFI